MPGDKLKKLHENLKSQGYDLPDYQTFEKDMADPAKLLKLHGSLKGEGYDIPDFETFSSDMGFVKKKEPSQYGSFPEPWKSPSQPQVGNPLSFSGGKRPLSDQEAFALIKRKKALSSQKVDDPRTATMFGAPKSGGNVSAEDIEKATNEIASIDQRFTEAGYDPKKLDFIADFEAPTNINEALKAKETNPEFLDRKIAATNWQAGLYNNINKKLGKDGKAVFNTLISDQYANNFDAQSRGTRDAIASVYQYSDNGDEQEKLIEAIKKDRAYGYGIGLPGMAEAKQKLQEEFPQLNNYQLTALLFKRDTEPETSRVVERLVGTDLTKAGFLGDRGFDIKLGQDKKLRDLEIEGMNLEKRAMMEKLKSMKAKGDLSQDEVAQYNNYIERLKDLDKDYQSQKERYPILNKLDANERMQDAFQQTNSPGKRFLYNTGHQVGNLVDFVTGVFSSVTGGNSTLDDLEKLGNARVVENMTYTSNKNQLTQSGGRAVLPDDIQKQLDELQSREDITDDQKAALIESIYSNNADKVTFAIDPTQKKLNLTGKAILNGIADLGGQLVPQLALAYVTGGGSATMEIPQGIQKAKELSSLFGSTFALGFNDSYTEALEKNIANPIEYAIVNNTINAASELLSSDFNVARRLAGGGVKKILNRITQAEWDKALGQVSRFQGLKETLKDVAANSFKNAKGEAFEEIAGGVAADLVNNELFGQDYDLVNTIRENGINTFIPMLGLGAMSLPFNYKSNKSIHKMALYEAGEGYDKYLESNTKALANNEISQEQFNTRLKMLEAAKKAYDAVPETKPNGQLLTDNEKADYAHLQFVQQQTKERIKEASTETAERMKAVVEEINSKKEEILSGPKEEVGLETKVEDTKNDYLAEPELFNVNIDNHSDTEVSIKIQDPKTGEMVDKNYKAVEVKRVLKNRSERLQEIFTCLTS